MFGQEVVYDATYTIGDDQLRVGTSRPMAEDQPSVLFFGDSFIYGEGLNDNQAIPYRFEEGGQGRFKAFNFGFHGYGPQQMLMWLDTGQVERVIGRHKPVGAVYLALADHINRARGRASWDYMGPRYELKKDRLVRGRMDLIHFWKARVVRRLNRSFLLHRLMPVFERKPVIDASYDRDVFIAMVDRSRRLFESRYGGKFVVIFWWERTDPNYAPAVLRLKALGIPVIPIDDIIPDLWKRLPDYTIQHDGHPNAKAAQCIADYLLNIFRPLDSPNSIRP